MFKHNMGLYLNGKLVLCCYSPNKEFSTKLARQFRVSAERENKKAGNASISHSSWRLIHK